MLHSLEIYCLHYEKRFYEPLFLAALVAAQPTRQKRYTQKPSRVLYKTTDYFPDPRPGMSSFPLAELDPPAGSAGPERTVMAAAMLAHVQIGAEWGPATRWPTTVEFGPFLLVRNS